MQQNENVKGIDGRDEQLPVRYPAHWGGHMIERSRATQFQVAATSFLALFSIVGLALYGLPLYYDFMVQQFGWSRTQVTSGNALSKLLVGPLFGFIAGWVIDRFGPRRLMLAGVLMAGTAVIGLGAMSALRRWALPISASASAGALSHCYPTG